MKHSYENYIEYLKTQDERFHRPIKSFEKIMKRRIKFKKEYPYIITYEGGYEFHDEIENWCRENISDKHGECGWEECPFGFDYWYRENRFDELLYQKEKQTLGPRPDYEDKENWNNWQKDMQILIADHYSEVQGKLNCPGDHSHKGVWKTLWLEKTGYDYGFQDYGFKNPEDAFYFKLIWDEIAYRN